jgi:hypothetical protein
MITPMREIMGEAINPQKIKNVPSAVEIGQRDDSGTFCGSDGDNGYSSGGCVGLISVISLFLKHLVYIP